MINVSVLLVLLAVAASQQGELEDWKEHNAKVEQFRCRVPQPRSFLWKELRDYGGEAVNFDVSDREMIYPWSTVLHRCESAGCCPNKKICMPKKTEIVDLVFVHTIGRERKYLTLSAENHTECSCQKNSDKPK